MGTLVNIPGPGGGDEFQSVYVLNGLGVPLAEFLETAPPYRPYPKPTQVDR